MRITTVIMKPMPNVRAVSLRRFLSITMFLRYLDDDEVRSSEVISRIIAVTASHRLMSENVSGQIIFRPLVFVRWLLGFVFLALFVGIVW